MSSESLKREAALLAWGKRNKKKCPKSSDPIWIENMEFEAFIEGFFKGIDFGMSVGIEGIQNMINDVCNVYKEFKNQNL